MTTLTVRKAATGFDKVIGLIGKQHAYPLFIETRFGIHTFGVRFPIDIIILDSNYIVKNIYPNMRSNRIFLWNPKYPYVIELPAKTLEKEKIKKGEKITLVLK